MKNKILTLYSLMALTLLLGCDNEPYEGEIYIEDNSCDLAVEASLNAMTNYTAAVDDNLSLMCQIYRDALQHQIEVCGDESEVLQTIINSLGECIEEVDPCENAVTITAIAQSNYLQSTDDNFEMLCDAYRYALLNQIEVCGDDGTLLLIIEDLGSCEVFEIEGTWQLTSWLSEILRDFDNDGIVTNDYLTEIDCYNNETIIFNADGTGSFFYRSAANITYTPVDNSTEEQFSIACNNINESVSFTWVQVVNTYSITMPNGMVVNHFRNGNGLYVAYDDGFYATSSVVGSPDILERITFVYYKL